MMSLIRKNLVWYFKYIIIFYPFIYYWFHLVRNSFSIHRAVFLSQWAVIILLSALLATEKIEDKEHGYRFLKILPVSDGIIILAKFSAVLISAFIFFGLHNLILFMIPGKELLVAVGRFLILAGTIFGLIACGTAYWIIYRFGYAVFQWITIAAMIGTFVVPFLIIEFILIPQKWDYTGLFQSLADLPFSIWTTVPLLGLSAFFGLMKLSIIAKKRREWI